MHSPIPLLDFLSSPLRISLHAARILSSLNPPLYIVAFTGQARAGKSSSASQLSKHFTSSLNNFKSAQGNYPCSKGIDMLVFNHPSNIGHFIFLDCEG